MVIRYSDYQRRILKEVVSTNTNIAISATAGSGKTTSLCEIAKLLPRDATAIFVAFNDSIVKELRERLPSDFEARTMHSLGLNMLYKAFGSNIVLNDSKVYKFVDKVFRGIELDQKEYNRRKFQVIEEYSWYRNSLIQRNSLPDNPIDEEGDLARLVDLIDAYNQKPRRVGEKFEIDFTDMIYLAVTMKQIRPPKFDVVLADEAQDMNRAQQQLLEMIVAHNGRMISVMDDDQAIYGFAGADSNSCKYFQARSNTVSLPLSITYRVPKTGVAFAKQFSSKIEAAPDAIEGVVRNGTIDEADEGDFILCRNNKPLIDAYFSLIAMDKKAYIKGKDIAEGLIKMVKPFKGSHIGAIFDSLEEQLEGIYDRLAAKGVKNPDKTEKYQSFEEKIGGLEVIAERCGNVSEMIQKIEEIFHPAKDAIVLSSIHKSKGLETDRVFILRWDLLPSKYAKTDEELKQENNLCFVATTRHKKELIFIQEPEEDE